MNNKKNKLIVMLLIIFMIIIVPCAVFATTQGVVTSAANLFTSQHQNNAEEVDSSMPGSGEILHQERTPVRVEDTANDATPTIMQGWDKTRMRKGDRVYIGMWDGRPLPWSVINPKGANITYEQGTVTKETIFLYNQDYRPVDSDDAVFLMTNDPLPKKTLRYYSGSRSESAIRKMYCYSDIRTFLQQFFQSFSSDEYMSVLKTSKYDSPYKITGGYNYISPSYPLESLIYDSFFPASVNEIDTYDCGIQNGDYWLRSALDNDIWPYGPSVAVMNYRNQHTYASVSDERLIRPAMNLNSNNVILTSAAEAGKPAMIPGGEMVKVSETSTVHYKLTLETNSRSGFTVVNDSVNMLNSQNVRFTYYGAKTGADEYISAIITEKNNLNNILYYGKLCLALEGSNTVSMKIPTELKGGNYTLKVFNEQCNADYYTDYSSPLREVKLYVNYPHVFYDNGGATGGDPPQDINIYTPGDEVTVRGQGNLVKKVGDIYYTFVGWSNGTKTYKAGDKFIINESDITLTAQWKQCRTIMLGAQLQYGSYVYMGEREIRWRVLNADGANITYMQDGITQEDLVLKDNDDNEVSEYDATFLVADNIFMGVGQEFGSDQKYISSSIRNWLRGEFIAGWMYSYRPLEILQTTKTDEAYTTGSLTYANQDGTPMNNILDGDRAFLLSAKEASVYLSNAKRTFSYWWWLRSPFSLNAYEVGCVQKDGSISKNHVSDVAYGVCPAINFNCSSVILTSTKFGGKTEDIGPTMLPITASQTNGYKFTLKDNFRNDFSVLTTDVSGSANEAVSFNYKNAKTGADEYISAAIMRNDGSNDILYYGRLKRSLDGSPTSDVVNMIIPDELSEGTYTVKVFNEMQYSYSDVDYSSPLRDVTLTVTNTPQTPPIFSSEVYND